MRGGDDDFEIVYNVAGQFSQPGDFLQYTFNVSEPGSLAIFGLGMLWVVACWRRAAGRLPRDRRGLRTVTRAAYHVVGG